MAAQQPRVETDRDAIWIPALARGLIRDDMLRLMRSSDGYTDLIGSTARCPRTRDRIKRPQRLSEYGRVATAVHLRGEQQVLEVACGPGEFTRFIAGRLSGSGFVIGLDGSVSMMERAVRNNSHIRAVYMLAEPLQLPFNNGTFDVVCCFAGLQLIKEPIGVLAEMVRVLSPGGLIAVLTSCGRESLLLRKGLELGAKISGVRVFDRSAITTYLVDAGLMEIDQQVHGISQFVTARGPQPVSQLDAWRNRRPTAR
jgi:SAM-dependent methyltransferase